MAAADRVRVTFKETRKMSNTKIECPRCEGHGCDNCGDVGYFCTGPSRPWTESDVPEKGDENDGE